MRLYVHDRRDTGDGIGALVDAQVGWEAREHAAAALTAVT